MIFNLIKNQKIESKNILFAMLLIVAAIVSTLLFVKYSMRKYLSDINRKYGNLSMVAYSLNGEEIKAQDLGFTVYATNRRGTISCYVKDIEVQMIVIEDSGYLDVSPLRLINKETASLKEGVFISSSLNKIIENQSDIEIKQSSQTKKFKVMQVFQEDDFYFVGNDNTPSIVISATEYQREFHEAPPMNSLYISCGLSSKEIRTLSLEKKNMGVVNVLEEKELLVKQASQTFLYAVSFIIVTLVILTLGGVYQMCKLVLYKNIGEIAFFRSMGSTFLEAMFILYKMVFILSFFSYVLGIGLGMVLGNIAIRLEYGYQVIQVPLLSDLLICSGICFVLPLVFLYIESTKYSQQSPIELLRINRNDSYDVQEDKLSKFIIPMIINGAAYIAVALIYSKITNIIKIMLAMLLIYLTLKLLELSIIVLLEFVSRLLKYYFRYSVHILLTKDLSRHKKRKANVLGLFILVLSIYITMYNLFATFRMDAVNKVKNQFNGDIFITDFQGNEDSIKNKIDALNSNGEISSIEVSRKQYMEIESSQIMAYFIRSKEFNKSFNFVEPGTSQKTILSDKGVVIGSTLARAGKINIGDTIRLTEGTVTTPYLVNGICDSNEYMGYVVYIPTDIIRQPNSITIFIKDRGDMNKVKEEVTQLFSENLYVTPTISTKNEVMIKFKNNAIKGTSFLEGMLFILLTLGVLVLLNHLLQFIDMQSRESAILRTLGLTLKEVRRKNYLECLIMIGVAIVFAILGGCLLTKPFVDIVVYVAKVGNVWSYHFDVISSVKITVYTICLLLFGLYIKLSKTKEENIVSTIKVE